MEFKDMTEDKGLSSYKGINRNIMEFKGVC